MPRDAADQIAPARRRISLAKLQEAQHPGLRRLRQTAWIVGRAIRSGKLVRPDRCSRCRKVGKIEGHHADYSKPLSVEWLCRQCHSAEHTILRRVAREARQARLRDPAHRIRIP